MSCAEESGRCGCGDLTTQRIRYFTGRHMTARDFRDEQAYHRTHRYLHSRLLHGWGVVCGLRVGHPDQPECRGKVVDVRCGMAIDCCGRDIVVERDRRSPPIPALSETEKQTADPASPWVLLLCLHYHEEMIEEIPVLFNEAACATSGNEWGRYQEGYQLRWKWVRARELPDYGWTTSAPRHHPAEKQEQEQQQQHHRQPTRPCPPDDCDEAPGEGRCCLEPQCPAEHCLPLAVLWPGKDDCEPATIDMGGRPSLEPHHVQLTHIAHINWPHGGELTPAQIDQMGGRLEVVFDRRLTMEPDSGLHGPRGVNASTFWVQYGHGARYEDLDFVPYVDRPHLEPDRRTAVFTIKDDGSSHTRYDYLLGHVVFIKLKCDFILDCHGNAVDGNHLGGRLPTGDGTRGGMFESWFRVVSRTGDEENEPGKPPAVS